LKHLGSVLTSRGHEPAHPSSRHAVGYAAMNITVHSPTSVAAGHFRARPAALRWALFAGRPGRATTGSPDRGC